MAVFATLVAASCGRAPSASAPDDIPPETAAGETVPAADAPATTTGGSVPDSEPATTTTRATVPDTEPPVGSCVDELDTRAQAALLVWPAVYADDWAGAVDTVRRNDVGGVLLMSQAGLDAATISDRLAELEAASRHGLIISTDEEGGDVQRLESVAPLASQREISEAMSAAAASDVIASHGSTIRELGIDMVLGPVVDVEPNVGDVPLQPSRFFIGGPDDVTRFGAAYLDGWARADLFATLKHFPGHGAASGDTHIADGVTPSFTDLEAFDLKPYRDLVDEVVDTDAAVMIGHLTVPGLTEGVPATRSPAAISYLRDDLGYADTLLITDALGMAAVGLPEPVAAVLALAAGIDVVLFTLTSQTTAVIDAIVAGVDDGIISRSHLTEAAERVLRLLERDGHTCDSNR